MPSMEKSDALRLEEYGNSKFLKRTWPGCAAYLRNLSKRLLFGEDTLRPALEAEIKRLRNLASGAMSLVDGQMFAKRADSLAEILERNPAATPPLLNEASRAQLREWCQDAAREDAEVRDRTRLRLLSGEGFKAALAVLNTWPPRDLPTETALALRYAFEAALDHLSDSEVVGGGELPEPVAADEVLGIFAGQETPEDAGGEGGEDDRERIAQLFQRWAREKRAAAKHFVGPNKDHTIWFAKGLDCAADYLLTFTPGQFPAPDGEGR